MRRNIGQCLRRPPFLSRQERGERTGLRVFPLKNSPALYDRWCGRPRARLEHPRRSRPHRLGPRRTYISHRYGPVHRHGLPQCPSVGTSDAGLYEAGRRQPGAAQPPEDLITGAADFPGSLVASEGIPKGSPLGRVFCPAFSARAEKGWPPEGVRGTT